MRKLVRWFPALAIVAACAPLYAATATDFYVDLLRRGVADVEAGRDAQAVTPLRLAAFGLLDSVEHYQLAQTHLVVAFDRLNQTEPAREAALRIVAAERVEKRFGSLALSPGVRTAFANSAKKLLPAADAAMLLNATAATAPAQVPVKPAVENRTERTERTDRTERTNTTTPTSTAPVTTTKPAATAKPSSTSSTSSTSTPPPPAPKPAPVQKPAIDIPARLAAGERALLAANLPEARKIYREVLDAPGLDHPSAIRVAEGLYRSRDFAGALTAFQRAGNLRSGEEAYRYYIAVAAYETGQFERAKRELAAALPFIEVTPDVQRYRARIEGAR